MGRPRHARIDNTDRAARRQSNAVFGHQINREYRIFGANIDPVARLCTNIAIGYKVSASAHRNILCDNQWQIDQWRCNKGKGPDITATATGLQQSNTDIIVGKDIQIAAAFESAGSAHIELDITADENIGVAGDDDRIDFAIEKESRAAVFGAAQGVYGQ